MTLSMALCLGSCVGRLDIIIDSDANAEVDDQHAIAYTVLNDKTFRVLGISVNVTSGSGTVADNAAEARRVLALCGRAGHGIEVYTGASGSLEEILSGADAPVLSDDFDGRDAVAFIIQKSRRYSSRRPLTVVALGKLTNLALALAADPSLAQRIRIVWLGTGYPAGGEHNLLNDVEAANAVIASEVPLEIFPARYGLATGTWAVRIPRDSAVVRWSGLGPQVEPVAGRHGGSFSCFGDYSADLWEHIRLGADGCRSMYDLVVPAVLKNPSWGHSTQIPACRFVEGYWHELPEGHRPVTLWENFDAQGILSDFRATLE